MNTNKICGYSCEHNKGGVCQLSSCIKKSTITYRTDRMRINRKPILSLRNNTDIELLRQEYEAKFQEHYNNLIKQNINLKQALIDIREIVNINEEFSKKFWIVKSIPKDVRDDILQIIDKVLGGSDK